MKRIVVAGLAVFAGLISGLMLLKVELLQSNAAVSNWQQGASIISKSQTDFASDSFKESIRNLKNTGANYVSLIIPYYQSSAGNTDIAPGWNTPNRETLISGINYIHSQGMSVALKPHLEIYTGEWRAIINPADRATWFRKYGDILNSLGDIGKETGAEMIVIGSELINMATYTSNESNTTAWLNMISQLRQRYSGKLTYSANWGPNGHDFLDEKNHLGFWPQLDFIGFAAYFNLNTNTTDFNALKSSWDIYRNREIEPLWNKFKKPILFTEVGYKSVTGAHREPWNYNLQGSFDEKEQADSYEALFRYWDQFSYMAGVHLWHWESNPRAGGQGNTDYTPQNKRATSVMSQWFAGGSNPNPNPNPPPPPPPNPPPPNPTVGWVTTASAQGGRVNESHTVNVNVKNSSDANDVVVDVEIYNQAGNQIFQKFFEHENIPANQNKQYSVTWTPREQGTYTVRIGIFNSNWSTLHHWSNGALNFTVGSQNQPPNPNPPPPTTGGPTVITSPAEVSGTSATISGTVNMNGGRGTVWFEYGAQPNSFPFKAGTKGVSGNTTQTLRVVLNNLSPNTTYYYKIMAENYEGTYVKKVGSVQSFTTR